MSEQIAVSSFLEYWREIEQIPCAKDEMLFYRGVSDTEFQYLPGIYIDHSCTEDEAYRDIILKYPEEFWGRGHLSTLVKMQHYGAVTRLLDLTLDPLTSLYFASESRSSADGKVGVLKIKKKEILHYNSDRALMLSCLPLFDADEQRQIMTFCQDHPGVITGRDIENNRVMRRFLHEIRGEYPAFEMCIEGRDLLRSYIVMPSEDNDRMKAQAGAFVIFGLDCRKGKEFADQHEVARILIRGNAKEKIMGSLERMRVTDNYIYPDLERTAFFFRRKKLSRKSLYE